MIFNMVGGGGGSGATLVVSSPANVSVTVSKDDKSYTKNSGSLGSTTFKGLATGTWTVTISGNGQTATKTIVITADYATTIAFFSATISITYPAKSTCVVKNSGGTTVASNSNTGSSTKTWTAMVNATGTYTVTATATDGSGNTKSQSVSITTDGQSVSVTLSYDLILYKNGVFSAESGDWVSLLRATINEYSEYFEIVTSSSDFANRSGFEKAIDLTEYSSLEITCSGKGEGYGNVLKFGVTDSEMTQYVGMGSNYVGITNPGQDTAWTDAATYSINIKSINKPQYIGIDGQDFDLRVYSIILKR